MNDKNDGGFLTQMIVSLVERISELPDFIFTAVQDRDGLADALADNRAVAKQREIEILGDVAVRMEKHVFKEEREAAGLSILLKDDVYVRLQEEIKGQRQLLTYADCELERYRHNLGIGLHMLDLLVLCSKTSGLEMSGGLFEKVSKCIDGITPSTSEPGSGLSALDALREHFDRYDTLDHVQLRELSQMHGLSEDDLISELKALYAQRHVGYFQNGTRQLNKPHWRLAAAS